LSSEYGWTTDYIFSLTAKETSWRIEKINKRLRSDFELAVKLHKFEIKNKIEHVEMEELTGDEEDLMKKSFEEAKQTRANNGR